MISYDNFFELVKNNLKKTMAVRKLSDTELENYMHKEEATIKSEYNSGIKLLEEGKITENVLKVGCVSSAANCLDMLWE